MKLFYLGPAIITLIFALMSEYATGTFSTIRDYVVSNPTSETKGLITKSETRLVGRWCSAVYEIRYDYSVGQEKFAGSRVDYDTRTDYARMLARYPLGKEVTVYYDPSRPQYATLEESALGAGIYGRLGMLGFCYLFFSWLEFSLGKYKKHKKK
jgi:hypothetical protein